MLWLHAKAVVVLNKHGTQKAEYGKQNTERTTHGNFQFWLLARLTSGGLTSLFLFYACFRQPQQNDR